MFRAATTFHHVSALSLETVLEKLGWTDVIRVEVEGDIVYQDDTGIANDLVPALDAVNELYLDTRSRYCVSMGRQIGPWNHVSRVTTNALGIEWDKSVRDRRLDPGPEECPRAHHERLVQWLEQGYLNAARQTLTSQLAEDLDTAMAAGLPYHHKSRRGPWLQLRSEDPSDSFGPLHAIYAGKPPSLAPDRVLLEYLLESPGVPPLEVRVDRHGTPLTLRELRDLLAMLGSSIAPLEYGPDGELELA